jgi:hypothetical protein
MSSAIAAARGWLPRQHLFVSNAEIDDWIVPQYGAGSSAPAIGLELRLAHNLVSRQLRVPGIALPRRGKEQRRLARSAPIPQIVAVRELRSAGAALGPYRTRIPVRAPGRGSLVRELGLKLRLDRRPRSIAP